MSSKGKATDEELLALLEEALLEEHGLELETGSIDYLRGRLYTVIRKRRNEGDNRFNALKITTSPTLKGHLWLVKETKPDAGT